MTKKLLALVFIALMVCGCETQLNQTQTGALAGSALGAGLGAIIGNQTGHAGAGTAIGAGAGALAGGLIGEGMRRQSQTQQQTQYYQPPVQQTTASSQVQEIHTKFCPTCGKTYPEATNFCQNDGTELQYIR